MFLSSFSSCYISYPLASQHAHHWYPMAYSSEQYYLLRCVAYVALLPLGFVSQRLEDKLDNISVAGGQSKPMVPEAILTCVQCKSEYKESENGEGSCKYHTSKLTGFHRYTYSCCNASSPSYESALALTGCTKGRHRSEHHDEYTYSAYFSYMSKVVSSFCIHCSLRA